jgi:hypothetical protein
MASGTAKKILENERKAIRQGARRMDWQVLRELKVLDGGGWVRTLKLEVPSIGTPSYFLQISREGSTERPVNIGIEAEDIRNLARFFAWLDKNCQKKKKAMVSKYMKQINREWRREARQGDRGVA